jgi:hypothetical protein
MGLSHGSGTVRNAGHYTARLAAGQKTPYTGPKRRSAGLAVAAYRERIEE